MLAQRKFYLSIICVLLVAGCSKKPDVQEVQQYLSSQLGRDPFYAISALQIELEKAQNDKQHVTFKAELKVNEPLYRLVDVEALIRKSGWDDREYIKALAVIPNLPEEVAKKLVDGATFATTSPTLVEQTATPGEIRVWYGSVDATHVVDKWSFSNLSTQERQEFSGELRSKFGTKSYVMDTPEATEAIDSLKKARAAFTETVKANMQLVAERKGREEAEHRVQELALAQERAMRRMPVKLALRPATFGPSGKILIITNASDSPLTVDLFMSNGQMERRLRFDLPPLVPRELGWLQGWSLKSGDTVTIDNSSYDQVKITIP